MNINFNFLGINMTDKQVAMITSLWITAENIGSFLGAVGGGAAYDRCASLLS